MRTISAVRPRVSQLAANQPGTQRFTPRRLAAAMAAGSLLTLSLTLSLTLVTAPAVAQVAAQTPVLPTGLSVVAGQAQAVTNGNRMTVTNSSQAILNWNSFSIGAGNAVYFQQPGVTSQVLNRVTGNDPSLIMGSLGSNGRVWLLNQNGVLFGQNARVDVAGLVASTLRLNDSDWLAGRYRLTEGSNASASVLNQGEMRTSFGGSLALVSGSVGNEGLMQAPGGQVMLAAGKSVELVDTGAAYLSVRITAPEGEARNLGVLDAGGGRIDIHAAAVNQQGIVRADALTSGPGGEVWIKASDSITLAAGSRTSANGAGAGAGAVGNGGTVTLQSDAGRTTVQGTVSAVGQSGSGGQAVLLGREVSVQDTARVDVSGSLGGGSVVVGGGTHGQDLRYTNAQAVYFGPQASIVADATVQGDGGSIVLWSDASTRAYGTLTARGGLLGGNGGHIETSGGWLDAQPLHVDTSAPLGQAGEWLLDPYNITVSNTAFTSNVSAGPSFTSNGANSAINQSTINAALVNSNVTIYTGGNNGGGEAGNITITNAAITSNVAAPRSITFIADRAITMTSSSIQSGNGALSVQMQSAQTAGGGIGLNGATIVTGTGTTWGDIVFSGAASGQRPDGTAFSGAGGNVNYGIELAFSTLSAGPGSVTLSGTSSNSGGTGVSLIATTLAARNVAMTGDAPNGDGVRLSNTTFVQATQTATLRGRGLARGVFLVDDAQLLVLPPATDNTASLLIDGISRTPTGGSGVLISTNGSTGSAVLTGRGASLVIRGSSVGATDDQAVRITDATSGGGAIVDASGGSTGEPGSSLLIQASGNGRNVQIDNALVVGPTGATQVQAPGSIAMSSNATLVMLGNTTFTAGDIALSGGADLHSETASPITLALNAQSNIAMTGVSLGSFAGPVSMSLLAGLGGSGTVTVNNSTLDGGDSSGEGGGRGLGRGGAQALANPTPQANANFGDIVIGGSLPGTTPTGGSFTGAGSGGNGVAVNNTSLYAGSANVSISGVATASGGVGVSINGSGISGNSVTILGDAPSGDGVRIQSTSYVGADHDLTIKGRGLNGVTVADSAAVALLPPSFDTTAVGLIQGRALSTSGTGVLLSSSGLGYALEVGGGASFVVEAASASTGSVPALLLQTVAGSNQPLVDATGSGALTLRTFDNGRVVQLTSADVVGGDGRVTVQAANEVNLSNAVLTSNGAVSVIGPRVLLQGSSAVQSQAAGDAIVLSGSNAPMTTFLNTAGSGALIAANAGGRWIVYGTNINDAANFNPGGLNYAFTRHNAAFGAWSADAGNGLVFSAAQTATYTGTVQNKVYDATTAATLGNVSFAFSVAGSSAVQQSSNVTFASPNAGNGIAASFVSATPYTFRDSSNRPIYGFTVGGTLTGNITPKNVSGTVTVPDRVYDATTTAVLNIGPLSGLVGTQTLVASASGTFANKNVGSNKAIAVSYALANGSNGGLASNYQFVGPISPTGNITQRPLAVAGVTANNKVYDATTAATLAGAASVTALAGDTVTLGGSAAASFNNKNVGTAKPVTVTGYTISGTDAANYSLVQPAGLTANITPRAYVVGGLSAANKVYDATTAATVTGTASGTALGSDNVTVNGTAAGSFADKNVGVGKPVAVTGLSLSGTDAANYSLVLPGLTASITQRAVSLTGITANNKVYDATTAATLSGTAAVSALSGDVLTVAGAPSASFANKNVGTSKPVSVTGYTLAGADAGNYSLVQPTGLAANITPRPLAVAGVTANNKVYDATTQATLAGTAAVTALAGDSVGLGGSGAASFIDKNVGTAKPVTVTGYTLTGADAGNYSIVQPSGLGANITPRPYVSGGLAAADKVYDATTAATLTGSASGNALPGDNVTVSGTATGTFGDKNVGTGKAITLTGLTLGGTDAANYSLVVPGLTASITPRLVSLTGITANNKVYDATTVATLSGTAAVSALSGDVLTVAGAPSASFANKNVGTGKPVSVTGYTLAGADAGNYALQLPTGLTAAITPFALGIGGLSAADKVYDATTAATLVGTAGVAGLAGDAVSLGGSGVATFNDKNVGTAKPVGVSGFTLTGADAANYSLLALNLSASITPRQVFVTGLSFNDKVYDATTVATLSGTAAVAALGGDALGLSGTAVARFGNKDVGANKPVTVTGYTLAGADAGNYSIVQPAGQASITPRALAIAGVSVNNKVYDATTTATLSGTAAVSALAGDSVVLGGTALATFNNKNVGTAKPVSVTGYQLSGVDAGNYLLAAPQGLTANITPLQLLVTGIGVVGKVYDATTAATLSGSAVVASLAGDAVAVTGAPSATFNNKNVGTAKPVTVSGFALSGADAANYTLPGTQLLAGNITPRPLVVTGVAANGKVYDGSTAATLAGSAGVSAISGDVVQLGGTAVAVFADPNAGAAKPVGVTGYAISGADAGNYNLLQPQGLNASITPAALSYVADPAVRSVGQTIVGLTGTVTGFVNAETQATATSGALVFTTPATPASPAGNYPIQGGGLVATNYSFGQAAANAQALSVVDLSPTTTTIVGSVAPEVTNSIAAILAAPRVGADSGVANLTAAVALGADPGTKPVGDFKAVRLSSLSTADIQGLLAGRDLFKKALLADSVQKLQDNPRLADLRECQTVAEAESGRCLITDRVKAMVAQQQPAPAVPAEPTPPTEVAGAPAPAPATPAVPATPPLVATAPTVPPRAPAPAVDANVDPLLREVQLIRRRVLTASLPQIERKVALVIGVDNYTDKSIPALGNAVRDARAVAQLFESKLGYEAVVLPNASKATLVGALNKLALTMGPRDSVVIYYAGHGQLVESTQLGYWLLADSGAKDPESWLSNTDISRLIGQIGASQVALISDSCYSGSLVSEERIRAAPAALDPKAVLARKSVVIMSSGGNEPVFDEGRDGHSPFAWNLMNTLNKVSDWQPGGNVFERVRFAVARELPQRPQYSASRAAGHQAGGDYLFEQRELAGGK